MTPFHFDGVGPVAWAARIRAAASAKTPAEVEADRLWMDEWMASLPTLPLPPLRVGECIVVFQSKPKGGGSK